MRGSLARKFKKAVMSDLYGDEVPKDQVRLIRKTKNFIAIYRRAKKNYIEYGTRQEPVFKLSRRQKRLSLQSNQES